MTKKQWIKNGVFASDTITINGCAVSNPTEEMLQEAGYEEYQAPEPSDEEKLETAKQKVLSAIASYDSSTDVNQFVVNGVGMWFEPSERATIQRGVESCQKLGRTSYEVTYGGKQVSIPCDTALGVLAQIEVYALDCLSVTNRHKTAVSALTTVADVEAYDYKSGYPEKLTFEILKD